MCQSYDGDRTLLPIGEKGLGELIAIYSSRATQGVPVPEALIRAMFKAVTTDLYVGRINYFTALVDLIWRHYSGEKGMWGFGPEILFSAHMPRTLTRYRSPEMTALHEAWLTFQMSEVNRDALGGVLAEHDIALVSLCCCGGSAVARKDRKEVLRRSAEFNRLRTLSDAFGQVIDDVSLAHIPDEAMESRQRLAFERISVNMIRVARAQKDCPCCTVKKFLAGFDIDPAEVARAESVSMHTPQLREALVA